MSDSRSFGVILDGCSKPNMTRYRLWRVTFVYELPHQRATFCEHLKNVPISLLHRIEHLVVKAFWYVLVKEIAHGIDEYHFRFFPEQRLMKSIGPQFEIKPTLKWMTGNTAKTLWKAFGIAIVTTSADFRATRDRVPSRIGPFDCRILRHFCPKNRRRTYRRFR